MRKALLLLISILMIYTMFTMVSCENNVYLPGNDTWCVQDMYFQTFGEALAWLMGQGGGASRDLIQSDIPENQTIYLMRDVSLSENAGAIEVPASFAGSLCIDFRGHEYWFSSKIDKFFNIQGGDRIDIINGKTIISRDASSGSKAVIVNVNTVTIDDHLVDDRRPKPQAIEVGPKGVLVIKSASNNRTDSVLNGAFDIQTGGELRITGGVFRIDSIADPAAMTGLVITGGVISNPHELSVYVDAAIALGGHPEDVQTTVIHDISDLWIQIDPEKHYKTCSGCTLHFEEAPHIFSDWEYDSEFNGQRQCKVCGRIETMDHVHTLVFHPAKDPTCTVPGNIAYYGCEICEKNYLNAEGTIAADDVILTKPHTLTQHAAVAPTCTEAGNIEYWTCEECHQYFIDAAGKTAVPSTLVVNPAKGHAWGEWTVVKAATCTEAGLERRVCTNDAEHTEEKTIEALGHELTAHEAKSATCTEAGNSAYWECSRCGKYFSDAEAISIIEKDSWIIPATGHAWKEEWATDNLYHWHVCTTCGEINDKAEHTLGEWTYNPETGKMDNECTVCQKEFHQDHVHNESNLTYHPAVPHTCTENGNREYYECSECGKKFVAVGTTFAVISDEDIIDPASHKLSKNNAVAPTCESEGNIECWICEECGKYFSDAAGTIEITLEDAMIPALGHAYGDWIIDADPTCTVAGSKHRVCANDNTHIEREEIPAKGHTMSALIAEVPATCEEDGVKAHYHCSTCNKDFEDAEGATEIADLTIPATGHVSLTKTEGVAATCIEDGFETYWTCDECGQKFSDAEGKTKIANPIVIPATGHDMTYVPAVAATCTTDGNVEYWHCENCELDFADEEGEETLEVTVIPATGHHTDDAHHVAAKDATCTEAGNTEYWTCKDCGLYFSDAELKVEKPAEFFVIPAYGHAKTHYDAVAATCTATGNVEYWHCSRCGKNYADEDCTRELETVITPMIAHTLTHHDAVAPTCVDDGNFEYWTCDVCHKYFSDAQGQNEIDAEDIIDDAVGAHSLTHVEAKAATCTEDGNIEYWTCDVCEKFFSDAACEHEIEEEDTVIDATGHSDPLIEHAAVAPTCTEEGNSLYYECSTCHTYFADAEGEEEIEEDSWILSAHEVEHHAATEATEETHGNIEYWYCTVCKKYYSDEDCTTEITQAQTVVHNWSEEWTSGLIDSTHYHWHVCTVCGEEEPESKVECTPIYQHNENQHWQICEVCEAELSEKVAHIWDTADEDDLDVKFDEQLGLHYVECECGRKLYEELGEVSIGEITAIIGTDSPAGTMLVQEDDDTVTVSYVPAATEKPELSCRLYIDGVWSGENLDPQQNGAFVFQTEEEKEYRVMLIAENDTGVTIYEKVIGD